MARYVILSDIHGNMPALTAVVEDVRRQGGLSGTSSGDVTHGGADVRSGGNSADGLGFAGIFLLGDLVDYGMQSNEVVSYVKDDLAERVGAPILASIWGNHERAVMTGDYARLSSERTVASAKYTASILTGASKLYIEAEMKREGWAEVEVDQRHIYLVHGSGDDIYFGAVLPEDVQGDYREYDLVLSGHTHFPHVFTRFYPCEDEALRNKKPTVFINPGSVGQPRNRNPLAQYAIWDSATGTAELHAVPYDVEQAMSLYHGQVDDFYRDRLARGV